MPRHKLPDPMTTLTTRVPPSLAELVRRDAAEAERTRSQVVKIILARHYARQEAS